MKAKTSYLFSLTLIIIFAPGFFDKSLSQDLSRDQFRARIDSCIQINAIDDIDELLKLHQTEGMVYIETLLDSFVIQMSEKRLEKAQTNFELARSIASAYNDTFQDDFYLRKSESYKKFSPQQLQLKGRSLLLKTEAINAFYRGGFTDALKHFNEALGIARSIEDKYDMAAIPGSIGAAYFYLGDFDSALIFYEESHDLLNELGDQRRVASTLSNMANVFSDRSEYEPALTLFKQASEIHARLNDHRGLAADYNNIGLVYEETGSYVQAREYYQKALVINTRTNNHRSMAKNMANMANVCINLADYREALDLYQQTLTYRQESGDQKGEGNDYGNIGIIYDQLGDFAQAESFYLKALQIHKETGYQEGLAYQYGRLAGMHMKKGDYALAINKYKNALAIHRDMGHARGEAYWLEALGLIYANVGDYGQALENLNQALALHDQIGNISGKAGALSKMGYIHLEHEITLEAENCFLQAMKLHKDLDEKLGLCLDFCNLAYLNYIKENTNTGIGLSLQADSLARVLQVTGIRAWIDVQLGDLYRQGHNYEEALRTYDRGLTISERLHLPDIRWQLYFGKGKSLEMLYELDRSRESYAAAISIIEGLRGSAVVPEFKAGLLHDRFEAYDAMITLLIRIGSVEEALNYLERSRARNMLDMLGNTKILTHKARVDSLVIKEHVLRAKINTLESALISHSLGMVEERGEEKNTFQRSLNEAQTAYHRLMIDLKLRNPAYHRLKTIEPFPLDEIQKILPDTTLILEYFFSGEQIHIFIITNKQVNIVTVPEGENSVRGRILLFRGTGVDFVDLEKLSTLSWIKPLQGLYELLVKPVEQAGYLNNIKHLVIVPSSYLHYLPFQALITHFDIAKTEAIRPFFLIEKFDISYSPSFSLLGYRRTQKKQAGQKILLLAPQTERLPQSRSEVQNIADRFGSQANVFLANEATERIVKEASSKYDFLHFATTAHFNLMNTLFSRLDLRECPEEDGHLEVHEIYDLNLKATLTTLSACQTALAGGYSASLPKGEDLVGLTRAFIYAGSESVIASLWEIADPATSDFMSAFYERLRHMPKVRALAETQREFISHRKAVESDEAHTRFYHPYYWAPFVLVGNWQ